MKLKRFISLATVFLMVTAFLVSCASEPAANVSTDSTTESTPSDTEKESLTLYVDTNVKSTGDGSETSPFKTIPEAQAKIRELKSGSDISCYDEITVFIKNGEYRLSEGLKFTEEDSGTESCPISYVAESKNEVVINGGIYLPVSDFEPLNDEEKAALIDETAKETVLKLDLTKYGITPEDIGEMIPYGRSADVSGEHPAELYINSNRLLRSRYPNDSFLKTVSVPEDDSFEISAEVSKRAQSWKLDDVFVSGYFMYEWSDESVPIANINFDENIVKTEVRPALGIDVSRRFYFLNVFAETDMPGEYYIDRETSTLYIYPTEDFENSSVVLSTFRDTFITAENVSYLSFINLDLTATRADGINISGDHIVISNCTLFDIRGTALTATGTHITIENNEIHNIGEGAILLNGGDIETLTPSNNLVYNNYIHDWSQLLKMYRSAIDISGCGNVVSHNEMHSSPHQAITWYGPNNIMEYNEIYDVCLEAIDCGAMYTGRTMESYGCIVRYNYIHNIGFNASWAMGIYFDDGLSGQTAYGNVVLGTTGHNLLAGGGRDNVIENNLFISAASAPAVGYDDRTRAAMFEPTWFTLNEGIGNTLVKTRNEYWNKAFEGYENIIPYNNNYSGDFDDTLLSSNPANNVLKNNFSFYLRRTAEGFAICDYAIEHGNIENNVSVKVTLEEINNWIAGDTSYINDPRISESVPNFKAIPFDEIGRIK